MERKITIFKGLFALLTIVTLMVSCSYQEIADAEYPDQKIYMPASVNGIFVIDNVPQRVDFLPTPGYAYRFRVDIDKNKLIVPLSVYRAGISRKGNISVSISSVNDTLAVLKNASVIPASTIVLPADKYVFPKTVEVQNNAELAAFDVEIDLNYLKSNPDAIIGFCISINSKGVEVNNKLKTTVVILHTKILKPKANFTFKPSATDSKTFVFTNTSEYGMTYVWNFGDGSPESNEKSPTYTYTRSGDFEVTLTAIGVTGVADKSVFKTKITVP